MKFNSIAENKSFQSHIEIEKIRVSRIMCALGAILFLVFAVVDLFALSATIKEVFIIRGILTVGILLAYVSTYYHRFFIKFYSFILSYVYISSALGIEAMIYLSLPEDHASDVYFAGLLLVIMTIFAWSYFKLLTSLFVTAVIIASFSYLEVSRDISTASLFVNIFFLVSGASIGFVSQLIRDRYLRENFLLQESLKSDYNKKSEEASDNEYLANHDPLTDLPNRRYMMELLNSSLDIASEKGKVLVIMFIDLNGFKQINDVYGHNAGDEVLLIVAKRLELAIRKGDHLSRLGGDEYLMGLMMEKENIGEVEAMTSKFVDVIGQSMNIEGLRLKVSASIGVAAYPIHGNNIEALINIADHRMYQVKKGKSKKGYDVDERPDYLNQSVVIFPGNKKSK